MEAASYTAWLVRDCHGNSCTGVVEDIYDNVQTTDMHNPQGYALCFDDDFRNLAAWCDRNGCELITEEGTHLFKDTFTDQDVGLTEREESDD